MQKNQVFMVLLLLLLVCWVPAAPQDIEHTD